MTLRRISGFRLVARDLSLLARFYEAIGFVAGAPRPIAAREMTLLGLDGCGSRLSLTLGPSRIDLDCFERPGEAYPPGTTAADLVFQHLALVTTDASSAWARALGAGATAISRDGPVRLPASSGGVTAIKFRDPEGHPLELLQFPPGTNPAWKGEGMLGIDHSAISVADVTASGDFYADRELTEGEHTLNQGPAQVSLDGLDEVCVDVVPLHPASGHAHIELLGYRRPTGVMNGVPAVNDVAATRIVWSADCDGLLRDPDGHLHQLEAR